jgi:hypothetical protein
LAFTLEDNAVADTPRLTPEREAYFRLCVDDDVSLSSKCCSELLAEIDALRAEMFGIELRLRQELWLGHGHKGVYGDDGEMQCSECLPLSRMYDYRREPIEKVIEAAETARMAQLHGAAPLEREEEK